MPWPIILRIKSALFNLWFILVHWLCFLLLQYPQTISFFHRCTLFMGYAVLILWWYLNSFVLNGRFITKTAARLKIVEGQMLWLLRISKKPQMNLTFCNVLLTFSKNLRRICFLWTSNPLISSNVTALITEKRNWIFAFYLVLVFFFFYYFSFKESIKISGAFRKGYRYSAQNGLVFIWGRRLS